jgi:hypothetical protein
MRTKILWVMVLNGVFFASGCGGTANDDENNQQTQGLDQNEEKKIVESAPATTGLPLSGADLPPCCQKKKQATCKAQPTCKAKKKPCHRPCCPEAKPKKCEKQKGLGCYWMENTSGNFCWVKAEWAPTFEACFAADSCEGGLGHSGGGCYKWASCSDCKGKPWKKPEKSCHSNQDCASDAFCSMPQGLCISNIDGALGHCEQRPESCSKEYMPVCGCDGNQYGNACTARAAGTSVAYEGECKAKCGNPAADPACDWQMSEEDCKKHGGSWGVHGMMPTPTCLCPTRDGGCPCDSPDQCEGGCQAPLNDGCTMSKGTCAKYRTTFGCFCSFVEKGKALGLCVD